MWPWPLSILKHQRVLYPSNNIGGLKNFLRHSWTGADDQIQWILHGTAGIEQAISFSRHWGEGAARHRKGPPGLGLGHLEPTTVTVHKTTTDVELSNSSLFLTDEDPRKVNRTSELREITPES